MIPPYFYEEEPQCCKRVFSSLLSTDFGYEKYFLPLNMASPSEFDGKSNKNDPNPFTLN